MSRHRLGPILIALSVVGAPVTGLAESSTASGADVEAKPLKIGKRLSWRGKVSSRCTTWGPTIRKAARRPGLDPAFMMAISRVESGFNPEARSRVGAMGLMQVMPSSGRRLKCGDLTKPAVNVECASKLMRKLLSYYDGRLVYAIAGYATGLRHPNTRRRQGRAPGTRYLEAVMRERSRYLRHGCGQAR